LAWFLHHLDLIDHYIFQFFQTFVRKTLKTYKKYNYLFRNSISKYMTFSKINRNYNKLVFENKNYSINLKKQKR
jgi:hypothetical protein